MNGHSQVKFVRVKLDTLPFATFQKWHKNFVMVNSGLFHCASAANCNEIVSNHFDASETFFQLMHFPLEDFRS